MQDIMLNDGNGGLAGVATVEESLLRNPSTEQKSTTPRFAAPLSPPCARARSTENSPTDLAATASSTTCPTVENGGGVPPPPKHAPPPSQHAMSFAHSSAAPHSKEQASQGDEGCVEALSIESNLRDNNITISSSVIAKQGQAETVIEQDEDRKPSSLQHASLQNNPSTESLRKMSVSSTPSGSTSDASTTPKKTQRKPEKSSPKDGQSTGRWTDEEHQAFLRGLHTYGREWKKVASHIPTRSSAQVRSHAQKYFAKLQKEEDSWAGNFAGAEGAAGLASHDISPPHEGDMAEGNGTVSSSVRANVTRIIAHPESVESEVEDTLRQLRARYEALQRRLQRTSSSTEDAHHHNPESPNNRRKRRSVQHQQRQQQVIPHDDQSSATSFSATLQNEELIALSVLRGGLPRGDGSVGASETSEENMETDDSTGSVSKRAKHD